MIKLDDNIVQAKICPYCSEKPKFVDSKEIYGTSYGMVYLCKTCDAYVGVHSGSKKALGRLANRELREAKKKAHFYFDHMWIRKTSGLSKKKWNKKKWQEIRRNRTKAYEWLSKSLGIEKKYTHIGMFDLDLCQQTIELCKPYYRPKK